MRYVILAACLALLGCSGPDDAPKLVLTNEATAAEQSCAVNALERWQAATGLELYQPVVADRGKLHDTVVHVRDDDPGKLGSHGYGHVYLYRPAIKRHQKYAGGGYDAMFEAVALHELGHQLGGADTDQPTGGIMGVDFAPPEDWRLCITQADLELVCPKAGCAVQVPEKDC